MIELQTLPCVGGNLRHAVYFTGWPWETTCSQPNDNVHCMCILFVYRAHTGRLTQPHWRRVEAPFLSLDFQERGKTVKRCVNCGY